MMNSCDCLFEYATYDSHAHITNIASTERPFLTPYHSLMVVASIRSPFSYVCSSSHISTIGATKSGSNVAAPLGKKEAVQATSIHTRPAGSSYAAPFSRGVDEAVMALAS